MAFSSIMTVLLLLSKIIFRFVRHPDQLAILRAPMVISAAVAPWGEGALLERSLGLLRASAAAAGRAALAQLVQGLLQLAAGILRELAVDGELAQRLEALNAAVTQDLNGCGTGGVALDAARGGGGGGVAELV